MLVKWRSGNGEESEAHVTHVALKEYDPTEEKVLGPTVRKQVYSDMSIFNASHEDWFYHPEYHCLTVVTLDSDIPGSDMYALLVLDRKI